MQAAHARFALHVDGALKAGACCRSFGCLSQGLFEGLREILNCAGAAADHRGYGYSAEHMFSAQAQSQAFPPSPSHARPLPPEMLMPHHFFPPGFVPPHAMPPPLMPMPMPTMPVGLSPSDRLFRAEPNPWDRPPQQPAAQPQWNHGDAMMPMHPMQGVGGGYMHMPLRMPQPDNAGHAHMQMCPPHFGAPIGAASGPFQHAADPWARSDEPTVFSQRWLPPQVAARAAYFDHASRSLPPVPQFDLAHAACATFSATGYAGTIAGIGRPNASSSTKRWRLPTVGAATPCRCRWLARRYDRDSACCSYSTLFSCTSHSTCPPTRRRNNDRWPEHSGRVACCGVESSGRVVGSVPGWGGRDWPVSCLACACRSSIRVGAAVSVRIG